MNILFITANRIGDAALTTGLYAWLVERHPGARVTVACGPLAAPLFAPAPGLERLIVLAKQPLAGHWRRLWRETAGRRWDLVVDLRDSLVSRLVFARRRLILSGRAATTGKTGKPTAPCHKVETLARLVNAAPPPAPRLWLTDDLRRQADLLINPGDLTNDRNGPLLALAPTANWTGKEWPAARFAETARRLTAPDGLLPGARVMVFAAPAEAPRAQALVDALPPQTVINLIGRTDALTAAACIARAALFIGNDSGLMHLAAAAGVATLGLFGPGFPEIYGPWGARAAVVVSNVPAAELRARVRPDDKSPPGLMDGVTIDAVLAAAARLMQDGRRHDSRSS